MTKISNNQIIPQMEMIDNSCTKKFVNKLKTVKAIFLFLDRIRLSNFNARFF